MTIYAFLHQFLLDTMNLLFIFLLRDPKRFSPWLTNLLDAFTGYRYGTLHGTLYSWGRLTRNAILSCAHTIYHLCDRYVCI